MNEFLEIVDFTVKIGGILMKKAEIDNDYHKIYFKVFEKITTEEFLGHEGILEVLGSMGG